MKKHLLAVIVLLIILVGCTGKMENGDEDTISMPDQNQIKEYIQPKMEGEITISAMNEYEYLTIAAQKFMSKYPNVKVKINSFMGKEDNNDTGVSKGNLSDVENYRNHLNTKLMTGKAEDIIFTGQLPVDKYVNIGVFQDLSKFLKLTDEINSDNYFMNVLEAPKDKNGNIYTLPIGLSFPVARFDAQLVTDSNKKIDDDMTKISFEKAAEFAQQLVDNTNRKNTFLSLSHGAQFFNKLFNDYGNEFIDMDNKKANITEQFVSLLNYVKDLENKGYFDIERSIDFYNMEYYFAFNIDFDTQAAYYSLLGDTIRTYAMPLSDARGNVYLNSNYSLGISSGSKNKELAWEFVKFLLSDEVQSLPSFHTLGVNKKGFESMVERNLKVYNDGNKAEISKEEYKSLLEKWVMEISAYDTLDPIIMDFVWEESIKFFEEKQSAEETARILQGKIDKYFNE